MLRTAPILGLLLTLVVCLLTTNHLFAKHIVGGEVTYKCIGQPDASSRTYEINIYVYRDPRDSGAQLDSYGSSPTNFEMTVFRGTDIFSSITIDRNGLTVSDIKLDDVNPCFVYPPNLRFEGGKYTTTITLPISTETYTLSYQRCCRNNVISNIVNPGDAGATYLVQIPPIAQQSCNSSPAFKQLAPIIICEDELLEFDHSATDVDGDELVYSLVSPYFGGGNDTDNPETPGGVAPSPETPPPYDEVVFRPPFTPTVPIDGVPPISIDPKTGMLTVNPQTVGTFVLCVAVTEFRNGVQIGQVRRDFQFLVTECDPLIKNDVQSNAAAGSLELGFLQFCGTKTIELTSISTPSEFVEGIKWIMPQTIDGTVVSEDFVVPLEYENYTTYPGRIIINPDAVCRDSLDFEIRLSPPIFSEFTVSYDDCRLETLTFTNDSYSDGGTITGYEWNFGNNDRSNQRIPNYVYEQAGEYNIELSVYDDNNCSDATDTLVSFFPLPTDIPLVSTSYSLCAPATVELSTGLQYLTEEYDIEWSFGDGNTSTDIVPTVIYASPGQYTPTLNVTSPLGCATSVAFDFPITVLDTPIAGFTFMPEEVSTLDPTIYIQDSSIDANRWSWQVDDDYTTTLQNFSYTFVDSGYHQINQYAYHPNGCLDTLVQQLYVTPYVSYWLPNAFTPNDDGTNDTFAGTGILTYINNFNMQIFNRWGDLVFETSDPTKAWNGLDQRSGKPALEGVYLCIVDYSDPLGKQHFEENVTLLR